MVAPTIPRDAPVKKRLREFFNVSPDFLFIVDYLAANHMRSTHQPPRISERDRRQAGPASRRRARSPFNDLTALFG
jgi:hypothetical protein